VYNCSTCDLCGKVLHCKENSASCNFVDGR